MKEKLVLFVLNVAHAYQPYRAVLRGGAARAATHYRAVFGAFPGTEVPESTHTDR
ncbi:hypothetical protein LC586_39400 [Nostoc sp. CHAB 5714]|jgi:hypothetical protein|uniref:Uncharacterized protein n=1 Tax=Nostoc favosum CHAB5714 TaxID=2780399 RepID=A0ABS8ILL6_9NOSO|nr:hypothetical protein [Nostoc favosum]MCC5605028.1 hypothetical protein [Nostoc favosum CHAB5714]